MRPRSQEGDLERAQQAYRQERLQEHMRELRDRGIDPVWIGSHEVKPICCSGCGTPIPWNVLKGWKD